MSMRIWRAAMAAVVVAGIITAAMASDEVTAQITMKVVKGLYDRQRSVNDTFNMTNANPGIVEGTQYIETNAWEEVTAPGVQAKSWTWFRNLSTNNIIVIGVVDANTNYIEMARLRTEHYGLIPLGTNAIYAISYLGSNTNDTTGANLEKWIITE